MKTFLESNEVRSVMTAIESQNAKKICEIEVIDRMSLEDLDLPFWDLSLHVSGGDVSVKEVSVQDVIDKPVGVLLGMKFKDNMLYPRFQVEK